MSSENFAVHKKFLLELSFGFLQPQKISLLKQLDE